MAIDVRKTTQEIVAQIDHPAFLQQLEDSLAGQDLPVRRFVGVAKTAIRTNPDLVSADQTSLFASLVRCAQDGLLPDGREAALVIYKGKVGYLPMIGGIRRIAAIYGWQIRTNVVYSHDEFDYTDEPPEITHRPVRPGETRGDLVAAYAVAVHRDGRRVQVVLHPEDIAKRRAKAQTQAVWNEWTAAMWEKSAGHAIFGQLSLDPADARVSQILSEGVILDPIKALYGPQAPPSSSPADATAPRPPTDATPDGAGESDGNDPGNAAADMSPAAAADPGPEDADWEPVDEEPPALSEATIAAAAQTVVPSGVHKDATFAQVAETEGGPAWFLTQLKRVPLSAPARPAIETFVEGRLPEQWKAYQAWKETQS